MKCIILSKDGNLRYITKRDPKIKKGWAKIKIMASGLCGSDITKIFSDKELGSSVKNIILGHEFSGIIENIEKNSKFKIGDKVVAQPLIFDKSNEITKSKSIGKDYNGGFSEYVLVPINNLIKLPSNISFDLATLTDVVAVCIHAKSLIDIQKNSKVLIIGDGAIGISMGMVLKTVCKKVYLKGKNQKNIGVASKIGIKTFDDKKKNLSSYDFIFETVGRKQDTTLSEAIKYISPKGKIVILGVYEKSYLNKIILRDLFYKEACLIGSNSYEGLDDFKKALNLISKYPKKFKKIITHKFNLKDFNKALNIRGNKKNEAIIKILFSTKNDKNNNF